MLLLSCATTTGSMADACCPQQHGDEKSRLLQQLEGLSLHNQEDERAAILMDLAEVVANEDPSAQAAYMQQVYEIRLKSVAAAIQGAAEDKVQQGSPQPIAAPAAAQPPPAAAATSPAHSSANSSSSADWDASDDWEPDVSRLRSASSFERQRERPPMLQPFQSSPQLQRAVAGNAAGAAARFALSEPSNSVRASSGGGGSSSRPGSSGGASRPRGRGQFKCGLPTSDSDDEALLIAAQSQPHIVEIYGLTRSVSTTHLETFLLDYLWGKTAANIKWVDDEHALAVFPCSEAAQVLLESTQRDYKVRPYSKASRAALHIPAEELTPPRSARPKTTTAVARRLIGNALGNSQVRDKAAEKELAELRKANKEVRKERQQQLDAAWGQDE